MSFAYLLLERGWDFNEWPEHVDVAHVGKVDHKRYVPERTCRNVSKWNGLDCFSFECSECGVEVTSDVIGRSPMLVGEYEEDLRYCPNCGAKVVEG